MKKSFNIQECLHYKSKHHETKPMHMFSLRAFQRNQECNLKHPSLVDLMSTNKTNKSPCFIDRFYAQLVKNFMWKFGNLNVKWKKKRKKTQKNHFKNNFFYIGKASMNFIFQFLIWWWVYFYFYFYITMTYESIFFWKLIHIFQYDFH